MGIQQGTNVKNCVMAQKNGWLILVTVTSKTKLYTHYRTRPEQTVCRAVNRDENKTWKLFDSVTEAIDWIMQ